MIVTSLNTLGAACEDGCTARVLKIIHMKKRINTPIHHQHPDSHLQTAVEVHAENAGYGRDYRH